MEDSIDLIICQWRECEYRGISAMTEVPLMRLREGIAEALKAAEEQGRGEAVQKRLECAAGEIDKAFRGGQESMRERAAKVADEADEKEWGKWVCGGEIRALNPSEATQGEGKPKDPMMSPCGHPIYDHCDKCRRG